MKNSFSFSRYRLLKSKNSGENKFSVFIVFRKNIVGQFLSVTSLMIFALSTKLTFIWNTRILVSSEPGSQKVNFEDFYGIFLSLPCGTQGIK